MADFVRQRLGIQDPGGINLVNLVMPLFSEHGLGPMYEFNIEGMTAWGIQRDGDHYVGFTKTDAGTNFELLILVVRTTGPYGGVWAFAAAQDNTIMASRNGWACAAGELDGITDEADFIRKVVTSALTGEELPKHLRK